MIVFKLPSDQLFFLWVNLKTRSRVSGIDVALESVADARPGFLIDDLFNSAAAAYNREGLLGNLAGALVLSHG